MSYHTPKAHKSGQFARNTSLLNINYNMFNRFCKQQKLIKRHKIFDISLDRKNKNIIITKKRNYHEKSYFYCSAVFMS